MPEFKRKLPIKRYFYSYLAILLLGVVFTVLLRGTLNVYNKERQSSEDLALLTRKYDDLDQRNTYLESEIDRLSTDLGIDEEIRDRFAVSKPGEKVVVIVDQDNGDVASETPGEPRGLWQRFLDLFK